MTATSSPSYGSANSIAPGLTIDGRYRVLRKLGRGGAGSVFVVDDLVSGRTCALKLLQQSASPRIEALFEREFYILSSLRHPNVVEAYEYGTYRERQYYTMELLEGHDLSGLAPLPYALALSYVCDAARALSAVHARHLLHRDLSPRNLWICDSGVLKLLDFGASADFGPSAEVAGTPPFIAPEALAGQPLDQRTDLYALGALLYWLLVGQHAFPARAIRDLPSRWREAPRAPSVQVARLRRNDLPSIPEDVDGLVLSLLSADPAARPATAGELIDRIVAMTGRKQDDAYHTQAKYLLERPAFAGRARERNFFARALESVVANRGGATLIEAARGQGGSRLLAEFALMARLDGAIPLVLDGAQGAVHGALFSSLISRLLDTRPDAPQSIFAEHRTVLATLSESLASRLGSTDAATQVATPMRAEVQDAVVESVLAYSAQKPIVLFVDRIEQADDASVAALAELAARAAQFAVHVVATIEPRGTAPRTAALLAFSRFSRDLLLGPLAQSELGELVVSIFSDVPYVPRLVERLYVAAHGNPLRSLEILRALAELGAVRHSEGRWVLPQDLPDGPFENASDQHLAQRLARMDESARHIARILSVAGDAVSLAACRAICRVPAPVLHAAVESLVAGEVIAASHGAYRVRNEPLRARLAAELEPQESARIHRDLGRYRLEHEAADLAARIDAVVHMLEGGVNTMHAPPIAAWADELSRVSPERLAELTPRLERALQIFRDEGRSVCAQLGLINALTYAGYFGDRRVVERYGPEAVRAGCALIGLTLARRLAPLVGPTIALVVGLLVGWVRFRIRRSEPGTLPFRTAIVAVVASCSVMSGMSALTIDPANAARCARMLDPLRGFGPSHPLALLADFPAALAAAVTENFDDAERLLRSVLARVDGPRVRALLSEDTRMRFSAGTLYALGVQAAWREDPDALAIADRLEQSSSAFNGMSADQIRSLYYATLGDAERYEKLKRKIEMHAIKRGTAWQVETWMTGANMSVALRTRDAMAMKGVSEQLRNLETSLPHLLVLRERAEGAHLVMRQRLGEALPMLEKCVDEPAGMLVGWSRAHGVLASALRGLGRPDRAYEVADRAVSRLSPAERGIWAMTLLVQLERCLALLALGEKHQALEELQGLLARAVAAGPVTRGAIHEALFRVTTSLGDAAVGDEHLRTAIALFRSTEIVSLAAHAEALRRERVQADQIGLAADGEPTCSFADEVTQGDGVAAYFARIEQAVARGDSRGERARVALEMLLDLAGGTRGSLWITEDANVMLVSAMGPSLPAEAQQWVRERVEAATHDGTVATECIDDLPSEDPDERVWGGQKHRLYPLLVGDTDQATPIGAVVIDVSAENRLVSRDLLAVLSRSLRA